MSEKLGRSMSSSEIRSSFLRFFQDKRHTIVRSSSLIPYGDPTLLFTNAGMVQFKDVFSGLEKRPYVRAVTSQKCVRAGGKHNDLDNVGFTGRHHTFFEMLGNFSFGDYFKADAISFAWEFLAGVLGLPPKRLWVTVYKDDDEAFDLWQRIAGVPGDRIVRMGEEDNFWAMGDTGPCGPCSEIVVDRGEEIACGPQCGLGKCDCDRWLEIWNLVFMQFMRNKDGSTESLPKPSIDTGMGLERVASILQGADTNYETDLFLPLIDEIQDISGKRAGHGTPVFPFRVIADHVRTCAFLASDGVLPSNEGRGYVMRRILRRAARFGRVLGITEPFLGGLVPAVGRIMGDAYPELVEQARYLGEVLTEDETRFRHTLEEGQKRADDITAAALEKGHPSVAGKDAFLLYDTYGFPIDLTKDVAREKGLAVDEAGFERAMAEQRERSRKGRDADYQDAVSLFSKVADLPPTEFLGYDELGIESLVLAIFREGIPVDMALPGEDALLVFEATPFYAAQGGQETDTGVLRLVSQPGDVARVLEATRAPNGVFLHRARVLREGLAIGQKVTLSVQEAKRKGMQVHHTATHLIHWALRKVLGEQARQSGSSVQESRLRFDFQHSGPLTQEEIKLISEMVNDAVMSDLSVDVREMPLEEARKANATALFDEKYGDIVRVVSIGDFSRELCGGTHVRRTGEIGQVQITSDSAVAAGVRRLEAVAGRAALCRTEEQTRIVSSLTDLLGVSSRELESKIRDLLGTIASLEAQVARTRQTEIKELARELAERAVTVEDAGNRKVAFARQDKLAPEELRELGDRLKDKGCSVVVLGSATGGRSYLLVMVAPEEAARGVDAVTVARKGAAVLGGSGGGKGHMAQAGGRNPEKLEEALRSAISEATRLLVSAFGARA